METNNIKAQSNESNIDLSQPLTQPKFEIPSKCIENCPICFEDILAINMSITTCGHSFHCYCLLTAVEMNEGCPMCRHPLVKINYETDEEDEDNEEDEDDEEDEDGEESITSTDTEEQSVVSLDQLTNKIINLGYTMKDLIYILTPIKSNESRHTPQYEDDFFDIIDKIKDGRIPLSQRDTRTYSQVVRQEEEDIVSQPPVPEPKEEKNILDEVMESIDTMMTRIDKIHLVSISENVEAIPTVVYKWDPESIVC